MISVTSRARRRTQISTNCHRFVVHAPVVVSVLVCGDAISVHVFRIGVTPGTGLGHAQRANFGARVARWAQVVHAMAVDAYRNFGISLQQPLAVHAGPILSQLVGTQRWVVFAHETAVGVAMAAELRNLVALNLATKTRGFTHGIHVCLGGVAAMTTGAGQPFLSMDVLRELGLRYL